MQVCRYEFSDIVEVLAKSIAKNGEPDEVNLTMAIAPKGSRPRQGQDDQIGNTRRVGTLLLSWQVVRTERKSS